MYYIQQNQEFNFYVAFYNGTAVLRSDNLVELLEQLQDFSKSRKQ